MEKINLKQLLAGMAALTVVAPTTVGILASIDKTDNSIYQYQQVIYHIATKNYEVETTAYNDPKSIYDQITFNFIREKLDDEIKNDFKEKLFHFNKITIGNKDLSIKDLKTEKIFDAKINYNYGSIMGQTTNVTITVAAPNPIEENIVNEINNAEYELTNVPIKTTVNNIKSLITGTFIKTKLSSAAQEKFDINLFKLNRITEIGHDLEDTRLEKAQTLYTKIHYDYGSIKEQETVLIIEVVGIDDEQIAFAISEIIYEQEILINSSIIDLEQSIDADFIQQQLKPELRDAFNWVLLKFDDNKITVDGEKLTDEDLKKVTTIDAKINYSYGEYHNYNTNLRIIIK